MRMEAPLKYSSLPITRWVYLHAYGGTLGNSKGVGVFGGLSPCVWRHQKLTVLHFCLVGSISMRMEAPSSYPS